MLRVLDEDAGSAQEGCYHIVNGTACYRRMRLYRRFIFERDGQLSLLTSEFDEDIDRVPGGLRDISRSPSPFFRIKRLELCGTTARGRHLAGCPSFGCRSI